MKLKKAAANFHPLLIGIFPILSLYSHNIDQVLINSLTLPLTAGLVLAIVIWLISGLILKNIRQSAAGASLFLIVFYFFGRIGLINQYILTAAGLAVIVIGFVYLLKSDQQFKKINQFLNVFSLVLVGITLFQIVPQEIGRLRGRTGFQRLTSVETLSETGDLPDIYYLVFDRYANQPVLKDSFGFDNSEFLEYLEKTGFYVANQSYANYPKTYNSLASSLNFEYLDYLTEEMGESASDRTPFYQLMDDNQLLKFLKAQGYTIHHFGDWWQPTRANPNADFNYNYFILNLNEFTQQLIGTTLAGPVYNYLFLNGKQQSITTDRIFPDRDFGFYSSKKEVIERNNYRMTEIKNVAGLDGPKFVFAHILLPHDPFVFNPDCTPADEAKQEKMTRDEKYIDQLRCINLLIEEKVDHILAVSADEPIIIISSDEGPFPKAIWAGEKTYGELNEDEIQRKFGILNAFYLPGFDYDNLYPSISPVNNFRVVFNHYFGTDLELLEDRHYNIHSEKQPYKLIEVEF